MGGALVEEREVSAGEGRRSMPVRTSEKVTRNHIINDLLKIAFKSGCMIDMYGLKENFPPRLSFLLTRAIDITTRIPTASLGSHLLSCWSGLCKRTPKASQVVVIALVTSQSGRQVPVAESTCLCTQNQDIRYESLLPEN